MKRRASTIVRRRSGRLAGWLALVGQLVGLLGLPLPSVHATGKDLRQPFPCQTRRCGCLTAADCWTGCCCFSARERVAWAEQHDVEPPDQLVEEAREEEHSCCQGSEPSPCAHEKQCCSNKKLPPRKTPLQRTETAPFPIGFMARQCQGQGPSAHADQPAAPAAPAVGWDFDWRALRWLPISRQFPILVEVTPPVPPPRS